MLPDKWREFLLEETKAESFARLEEFLAAERARYAVFPPEEKVYRAFSFFPPEETRAVILGQDPYHEEGQAEGLAFSVPEGVREPPSLRNIRRELSMEFEREIPKLELRNWAAQGVLLLNTVLTVREGEANSHVGKGWETFTSGVLRKLSGRGGQVFFLWGNNARKLKDVIKAEGNLILESAHPSPLSARKFFGCGHFKTCNEFLVSIGKSPIVWC